MNEVNVDKEVIEKAKNSGLGVTIHCEFDPNDDSRFWKSDKLIPKENPLLSIQEITPPTGKIFSLNPVVSCNNACNGSCGSCSDKCISKKVTKENIAQNIIDFLNDRHVNSSLTAEKILAELKCCLNVSPKFNSLGVIEDYVKLYRSSKISLTDLSSKLEEHFDSFNTNTMDEIPLLQPYNNVSSPYKIGDLCASPCDTGLWLWADGGNHSLNDFNELYDHLYWNGLIYSNYCLSVQMTWDSQKNCYVQVFNLPDLKTYIKAKM